jgi:hypothetical protein
MDNNCLLKFGPVSQSDAYVWGEREICGIVPKSVNSIKYRDGFIITSNFLFFILNILFQLYLLIKRIFGLLSRSGNQRFACFIISWKP